MNLRVIAGQITYIERLYVYHYIPGAHVLWISLDDWEPPEGPLEFLQGEGKSISINEIIRRALKYSTRTLVVDGPLPYGAAKEFLRRGFKVAVRYDSSLELPKGTSMLMQVSNPEDLRAQLKSYDDVHLELYPTSLDVLELAPKDVPIHLFSWLDYLKVERMGFQYVYNHVQPYREDTKCPKCGTPNAVRENDTLLGWDGPRCRRCGFRLHYHSEETPEVPRVIREWLSWRFSVPVL